MNTEKKKLGFGGGMLIYITVMFTVIFVALAFWWHYLTCYEAARAERVMDNYMLETLETDLERAIMSYGERTQSGYQSVKDISQVLTTALSSDGWHYTQDKKASTDDYTVFHLLCGEKEVGQVRLSVGDSSTLNMGFRVWDNPSAVFDFSQFGKTLTIIAPYGCDVLLNGWKLEDSKVADTLGLYPQLEAYEAMLSEPNQLLVYKVEEVFADVAVEYPAGFVAMPMTKDGVYYAVPACDDSLGEQLTDYVKSFVRAYTEYNANPAALWALQQFVVTDSALYKRISDAASGKDWGNGENAKVQTVEIKNFIYYGNAITCDASFITTRDDGDRMEAMKVVLVNTDIGWRVVHIENMVKNVTATPQATASPAPTPEAETPAPSAEVSPTPAATLVPSAEPSPTPTPVPTPTPAAAA